MIDDVVLFNWTLIVVAYFLVCASISDYTKHEVKNEKWTQMLFVLSPIIAIRIHEDPLYMIMIFKALITTTVVGYSLFKIGLFGGADIKMVMALSIIFPINSYFMVFVLLLSLIISFPLLLLILCKNKNKKEEEKIVYIPFIPIISSTFYFVLYVYLKIYNLC